MGVMTEQHISAQEWLCDKCGGHDTKSCSCAGATATSREIQAKVERLAAKDAGSRQRQKAYRARQAALHNAPVVNTEESPDPEASAEAMKAVFAGGGGAVDALQADREQVEADREEVTRLYNKVLESEAERLVRILAGATPEVLAE